ncbi:hypothetical protein SAMN05720473_101624 [Fibrobacter sp. UWB15]|jgi:hypothetical protein|uniref:hypothetical protein n=1 Tax=unclassified Fibrobacter TaxID=2634177 RepID=UPI0009135056|nr:MULTISPECIES: hypothetical protein [unclassified Fibrobacter]PWJ67747.1 hypothetical protein BGW99_101624 [Fibrobacter sp. UWB6]SHF76898.1 hypothetical protein SAMN05720760_101589 [Fibrobacter sp. UWB8]SMG14779.1 hypothetical protein SAMN05720473_101624 [Fibrobacter sp. UWB15]
MKKLITLLFAAFLLCSCAPAIQKMSNFDKAYPLKGKTVVVVSESHKEVSDFANSVTTTMTDTLNTHGVVAKAFVQDKSSLSLSESPVADFAKEQQAEFLLVQNFTKVNLYNAALSSFEEELVLYSIEEKKPVWKASISWNNPMPLGNGPGVTAARQSAMELLIADGFVAANQ